MVGPRKPDFWPKINILKGNHCMLRIREGPVRQKIGHDFRIEVGKKCLLQKMVSINFFEKILSIFDIEN